MTERLLIFSDLHLAPSGPLNNFHAGMELVACLRTNCHSNTLLVFNGDTFDFLQADERRPQLVLADAPRLVEEMLSKLAATSWGKEVLEVLGGHVRSGGSFILIPGNHDPEMAHPAAVPALRKALGLEEKDYERLSIYTDSVPLSRTIGRWQVLIGHGHRGDGWNNIDASQVRQAVIEGRNVLDFPPGSHLVLKTLNDFKGVHDETTGAQKYAFIDLLKPETPLMLALLLWVAPVPTTQHLPRTVVNGLNQLIRKIMHRLHDGQYLGPGTSGGSEEWLDEFADQFVSVLTPSERKGDPAVISMRLKNWFEERGTTRPGMLSGNTAGNWFGRMVREQTRHFFDTGYLEKIDQRIVQTLLSEGVESRIVIAGHTHAARSHSLPGERLYLNTGTWTDLMQFPTNIEDEDLWTWRRLLLNNQVPRLKRLTYAEVTPEGGALRWWCPDPASGLGA